MKVTIVLGWLIFLLVFAAIIGMVFGWAIELVASRHRNPRHIGTLVIAPRDEDGGPYLYLSVEKPFETWQNELTVEVGLRDVSKEELMRRVDANRHR